METRDGCAVDIPDLGAGELRMGDMDGPEIPIIVFDLLCPGVDDAPLDMLLAFMS